MEFNKIRELLDRYWEGDSSLEEEAQLRSFFSANRQELPADLKEAASLFSYFAAEADLTLPELPVMETMTVRMSPPPVKNRPWQHWMKYAAIFLMAVGIGYAFRSFQLRQQRILMAYVEQDTYNDPEKAFAATQKALQLLAKNLNKGTSQVQKLSYFNEAAEKVKAD